MSNSYYNVPRLGTGFQTKLQAYTVACRNWKVQYGQNRQDADGIQWEGEHGTVNVARWSDLPAEVRAYE